MPFRLCATPNCHRRVKPITHSRPHCLPAAPEGGSDRTLDLRRSGGSGSAGGPVGARARDFCRRRIRLCAGEPNSTDVELNAAENYDLIVLGAEGRETPRGASLGPVARRILEHSDGSVLIGRLLASGSGSRILVAVDAIALAASWARAEPAWLREPRRRQDRSGAAGFKGVAPRRNSFVGESA